MTNTPFIPFYTSDFLAGTSGMTAATKGVYITLLCLIYETEAPLKQSWETLARRCGCTLPAFRRAVDSLRDDGKLTLVEGGLWSPKCEKHIAQRRQRHCSAKAAAKTRWEKSQEKQSMGDAIASSAQCQPEPEPESEPYKEGGGGSACARDPADDPPDQPISKPIEKPTAEVQTDREIVLKAMGADPISGLTGPNGKMLGGLMDMKTLKAWQTDLGLSVAEIEAVILELMASKPDGPPMSFGYFTKAMQRYAAAKSAPKLTPIDAHEPRGPGNRSWRPVVDVAAIMAKISREMPE